MAKGYKGETLAEAIRDELRKAGGGPLEYNDLAARVRTRGTWTDGSIAQDVMSLVSNLPPARITWPSVKEPFLFLHEDGRFELR